MEGFPSGSWAAPTKEEATSKDVRAMMDLFMFVQSDRWIVVIWSKEWAGWSDLLLRKVGQLKVAI